MKAQFSSHKFSISASLTLLLTLALMLTACASPSPTTQPSTSAPIPVAGEIAPEPMSHGLVDIGGRKLWFQCVGKGTPTVILEAGQGDTSSIWFKVQTGGDGSYRVCSYDRANLGESGAAPKPRTYLDMAHDLHALLTNAHIEGPYILVGHSGGGLLIRVFRDQYPEEVAGLVLVDAAHPDMGQRLLEGLPPKSLFESKALRYWRIWLSYMSNSQGSAYQDQEGLDTKANNALVKAAKPLGELPVVVISRSPDNATFEGAPLLPSVTNAKLRQIWQELQSELGGLSSNSTHIIASHAGHSIQREEPELVIDAIRKLVNEFRSQMQTAVPQTSPADQAHVPVILRVEDLPSVNQNGGLMLKKEIIFSDEAGDAIFDLPTLVSADPPGNYSLLGGFIPTSSDEQQRGEARDPLYFLCPSQGTFVEDVRIVDQAYNQSEPVRVTFTCPVTQHTSSPLLTIGIVAGLVQLVAVIWLILRSRRLQRSVAH